MERSAPHRWTFEEFFAFEAAAAERCELVDGVVHIMTGRSAGHSAIKSNWSPCYRPIAPGHAGLIAVSRS